MLDASLNSIWEDLPQDREIECWLRAVGIWDANLLIESARKRYVWFCSVDFGIASESK